MGVKGKARGFLARMFSSFEIVMILFVFLLGFYIRGVNISGEVIWPGITEKARLSSAWYSTFIDNEGFPNARVTTWWMLALMVFVAATSNSDKILINKIDFIKLIPVVLVILEFLTRGLGFSVIEGLLKLLF